MRGAKLVVIATVALLCLTGCGQLQSEMPSEAGIELEDRQPVEVNVAELELSLADTTEDEVPEMESILAAKDSAEILFVPLEMEAIPEGEAEQSWTSIGTVELGEAGGVQTVLQVYSELREPGRLRERHHGMLQRGDRRYVIYDISPDILEDAEDPCRTSTLCRIHRPLPENEHLELVAAIASFGNGPGRMMHIVYDTNRNFFLSYEQWGVPEFIDLDADGVDELVIQFRGTGMNWPDMTVVRFDGGEILWNESIKNVLGGGVSESVTLQRGSDGAPVFQMSTVLNSAAPMYSYKYDNGTLFLMGQSSR